MFFGFFLFVPCLQDQGLNPSPGSESTGSYPLDHESDYTYKCLTTFFSFINISWVLQSHTYEWITINRVPWGQGQLCLSIYETQHINDSIFEWLHCNDSYGTTDYTFQPILGQFFLSISIEALGGVWFIHIANYI